MRRHPSVIAASSLRSPGGHHVARSPRMKVGNRCLTARRSTAGRCGAVSPLTKLKTAQSSATTVDGSPKSVLVQG